MKKDTNSSSWVEERLEELKRRKQQTRKLSMMMRWLLESLERPEDRPRKGKMEQQMYRLRVAQNRESSES